MASQTSNQPGKKTSGSGSSTPNYYFVDRKSSQPSENSGDTQDGNAYGMTASWREGDAGQEIIDVIPEGATREEFASRPVHRRMDSSRSRRSLQDQHRGFFRRFFPFGGEGSDRSTTVFEPSGPTAPIGSLLLPRKVPVKIEPKVYFANERTFLSWLHQCVWLSGTSLTVIAYAHANPWSQVYGAMLLPAALAFVCYALFRFGDRNYKIRNRLPGPFEDTVGPAVLGIFLMVSIVALFAVQLYVLII